MPDAPAPLRGLRIIGYPTSSANASTSAALPAAVEAAVCTPASRSTCFIDGLSRHSHAVLTDVPGMAHASRTRAAASVCASIVASIRSTHSLSCTRRTWSCHRLDIGDRRHLLVVTQPALHLLVQHLCWRLAETYHRRADLGQRADEVALAGGEARLDEDDVHVWHVNRR